MDEQVQTVNNTTVQNPKKLSAHTMNLIIILVISILLFFDLGFRSIASQVEAWRFFISANVDNDLLQKLLPLRVGVAFVFLWYGLDNFQHPEIFNNLANLLLKKMHLEKDKLALYPFAYLQAIVEILVAISLVSGAFIDVGSFLGTILLCMVLFAYEEGLGSLLIRDIGLLGAISSIFILSISGKI